MKLIGLDSSGLVASVAIWEDGIILAEYSTTYKKTHSQTLLPMLAELKEQLDLDLTTVDAIAIAAGPGSFTGLRIGSATAKGMGLVLECPIVEVPTLEGLAYNLWGSDRMICPMMDARRKQVYTGLYAFSEEDSADGQERHLVTLADQTAMPAEELLDKINEMGRAVVFLGDGVPVFADLIREKLKVPYSLAPASCNRQRAASVACLGALYYQEGRTVSADDHAPIYLRKSQAEKEGPQSFEI